MHPLFPGLLYYFLIWGHIVLHICIYTYGPQTVYLLVSYDTYLCMYVHVWHICTCACIRMCMYFPQFDGVHIVSGSLDTSIRVWNAETGQCIHTLTGTNKNGYWKLYMHYNLNGDYVCGFLIIKLILEWQTSTWSHVNEVTFCTYYRWLVLHMHVHTYEFVLPAVYSGTSLSGHLS